MSEPEYINCSQCGEEVTIDSDFCPHCGTLFGDVVNVFCDTHPDTSALGICIICRKLVCEKCGNSVHGRIFCADHRKVEVQQDWAKVYQSSDINESGIAKAFLESEGYKVLGQNFEPVGFVWDGGGDSSISRSNISKPAKVFVPIPEFLKASEALKEWDAGTHDDFQKEE